MSGSPSFDDVFAVMSAASVGERTARVALPEDPDPEDLATRFAIALNLLLDDLAFHAAERSRAAEELREREQRLSSIYETAADVIFQLNAELELRVQERTAQLESANAELDAFSYSAAHDLPSVDLDPRPPVRPLVRHGHA